PFRPVCPAPWRTGVGLRAETARSARLPASFPVRVRQRSLLQWHNHQTLAPRLLSRILRASLHGKRPVQCRTPIVRAPAVARGTPQPTALSVPPPRAILGASLCVAGNRQTPLQCRSPEWPELPSPLWVQGTARTHPNASETQPRASEFSESS